MTCDCSRCRFPFEETSVQIFKRLKHGGPKLCKDCSRLDNGEKNAEKRQKIKDIPESTRFIRDMAAVERKHGFINEPLLMRIYKWSPETAREALKKYESEKSSCK